MSASTALLLPGMNHCRHRLLSTGFNPAAAGLIAVALIPIRVALAYPRPRALAPICRPDARQVVFSKPTPTTAATTTPPAHFPVAARCHAIEFLQWSRPAMQHG